MPVGSKRCQSVLALRALARHSLRQIEVNQICVRGLLLRALSLCSWQQWAHWWIAGLCMKLRESDWASVLKSECALPPVEFRGASHRALAVAVRVMRLFERHKLPFGKSKRSRFQMKLVCMWFSFLPFFSEVSCLVRPFWVSVILSVFLVPEGENMLSHWLSFKLLYRRNSNQRKETTFSSRALFKCSRPVTT